MSSDKRFGNDGAPAPAVSEVPRRSAGLGFKPRASQLKQQRYAIGTGMNLISEELLAGSGWKPSVSTSFTFTASEVDVYAVLSVAQSGDAAWMLARGVRTAEDAVQFLDGHGAAHRAVKRTRLAAEALKRGIPSTDFMNRMKLAVIAHPDDDTDARVIDVLELSTISSLSDQWGWVAREIRSGVIRLEDIKYLGVSKLKSYRRLVGIVEALQAVHEPDAKFSMDDLKYLVDRAAKESTPEVVFRLAAMFLIEEGVGGLKRTGSLKLLRSMAVKYRNGDMMVQRLGYEIDFRAVYEQPTGVRFPEQELRDLFDAGVPAERAGQLMSEGLSVSSVIGVVVGGTERALADGWL